MKPISLLCLAVAASMLAGAARADPTVADYEKYTGPAGTAESKLVFSMWLSGVANGLQWMDTEGVRRGQPHTFCLPEKFGMSAEQFTSLVDEYLKKRRAGMDPQRLADLAQYPTGLILLDAFKDSFPCKK